MVPSNTEAEDLERVKAVRSGRQILPEGHSPVLWHKGGDGEIVLVRLGNGHREVASMNP